MMVSQSAAVVGILAGHDGGWKPQRRGDGSVPFGPTLRHFAPHTLAGVAIGGAALAISVPLLVWMSPVVLGLLLAVPLVSWTARSQAGAAFARLGLLATPEQRDPPRVLRRAEHLAREMEAQGEPENGARRLFQDPGLLAAHAAMLPNGGHRAAGDYGPERLIARAKLEDARDFVQAMSSLTPRETAAALGDAEALERLAALARGTGAG
jgi:membrane glycosyltransferase